VTHLRLPRCAVAVVLAATACEPPRAAWMDESVPEPTVFAPGIVSSELRDYDITFTPDGSEAYFTRRTRRGPSGLHVTRWVDGTWTKPEPVSFAGDGDEAPYITPDGSRMFFASTRPMGGTRDRSENLWVVHRVEDGWGEPRPLRGTVNQPWSEMDGYDVGTESGPLLLGDDVLLYWTEVDPEWGSDLYVAERDDDDAWVQARPLRLNSHGEESHATLSPDGRFLVFQGYRGTNGHGDLDLYVSERTQYGWTDPRPLPQPVNSAQADGYPSFSPDGRHFFFASDRNDQNGWYDVFWVDVEALGLGGGTASTAPVGRASERR
jgi:hypothetical protein